MKLKIIQQQIIELRGQKVMLDFHLAELYEIETKVLKQAVRRNINRFPPDFMFELTQNEFESLRSQFVTSKRGGLRYMPFAFTEQGIAMLSSVLNSEKAIAINIAIMRTFVSLRQFALNYKELNDKITEIEKQFPDIYNILNSYIPDSTSLILNSDDPQCSSLKMGNDRVYFGIDRLDFEDTETHNIVRDGAYCPICSTELKYDFTRYHHIGKAHCDNCGYHTPDANYRVETVNREESTMTAIIDGSSFNFKLMDTSPINIYNQISAIALLNKFGMTIPEIQKAFLEQEISESRLSKTEINGKTIIRHLAKGQNPVACSRAMDNTRQMPGNKCVMMFLDDHFDAVSSVENIAWFYDTDFEFLNDDSIKQILIGGARHFDTYLRLLLAGVPEEKMVHVEDNLQVPNYVDFDKCDTFVIYYDVYTIDLSKNIESRLTEGAAKLTKEENANEN